MKRLGAIGLVVATWLLAPAGASAQPASSETIEIGLSTDRVAITSDFSGADLTIFGAIDGADTLLLRQGRYDVIVVLEGPARPVVVRKKTSVAGMWINTQSETFVNIPVSYSVATTRVPQDITEEANYERLALGTDHVQLQPMDQDAGAARIEEFETALRETKKLSGLYTERVGGVQFLSQTLFRATVSLPPNVPVGTHRARAYLFRSGSFIRETSASLVIYKSGVEQTIYELAHDNSLVYGFLAVALAVMTGWAGRIVFRRDRS